MEWLSNYFRSILLEMLKSSAMGFFDELNGLTTSVTDLTNVNPGTFNATLFGIIRNISNVALVPVATLILCYLMTINFIKIVEDKNTYKDMTYMPVFKWILFTTIGIILISKTYDIVLAVFDVVGWILTKAGAVIASSHASMDLQTQLNSLVDSIDSTDIGAMVGAIVQLTICRLLVSIVAVLCKVVMYFRIISILVYSSAAAIPTATLMDKGQTSTGLNYYKTLAALGLQGFFVMIVVAVFDVLIVDLATHGASSINELIWGTLMYVIALCMGLFSTKRVAEVTLGAR